MRSALNMKSGENWPAKAKGRPSFNPLIVHVASAEAAQEHAEWSDTAARLAGAFWPGPLTLVLPQRSSSGLSPLVTAGQDTVALRVPAHSEETAQVRRVEPSREHARCHTHTARRDTRCSTRTHAALRCCIGSTIIHSC